LGLGLNQHWGFESVRPVPGRGERRWQDRLDSNRRRYQRRLGRSLEWQWVVRLSLDVAQHQHWLACQLPALLCRRQWRRQGRLDKSGARLERRPGGALERRWQLYVLDLAERQHRRPEQLPTLFRRCQRRWKGGLDTGGAGFQQRVGRPCRWQW